MMQVCDYSRSFASFVLPINTARLQVEARCLLALPGAAPEEHLMFASCKSEVCYVEGQLFLDPNYDFSGIFSDTRYRLERIHADASAEQLDCGPIVPRFDGLTRHIHEAARVRPLTSKQAVIDATLAHQIIVARNEIRDQATGASILLEYPVKTMNVHRETATFQVDTGPVPLFDFRSEAPEVMGRFLWAYVAFNDFSGACFVSQVPTPIARDGAEVARTSHYSLLTECREATNSLFAIEEQ
jgi:hypothetical protein